VEAHPNAAKSATLGWGTRPQSRFDPLHGFLLRRLCSPKSRCRVPGVRNADGIAGCPRFSSDCTFRRPSPLSCPTLVCMVTSPQPMKFFLIGLVALAILVLIAVRLLRGRIPVEGKAASPATSGTARTVAEVDAFTITLDVDGKPSLFVLLAADGAINRMGRGTLDDPAGGLFIGQTDPAIFKAARSHLSDEMVRAQGHTLQHQNPRGLPCKLTLTFKFKDGTSGGLAFLYGSESEGVPGDIADFVTTAVRLTDPWYENFKRTAAGKQ